MMLAVAGHEFRYTARSMTNLVLFIIILGFSFLLTANSGEFMGTAKGGNVYINSPYMITLYLIVLGVFSSFLVPSYLGNAVLKDRDCGFAGILFSTPITEGRFLGGRFLGAFAALILVLAAAPLGMILGNLLLGSDSGTLAPLNVSHYGIVFFGFMVPSMLVVSAFIFSVAAITGRMLYTYIIVIVMIGLYMAASETNAISPLWDPFMHRIFEEYTKFWTAAEMNTQMVRYEGIVLWNRALWVSVAALLYFVAFKRFSFQASERVSRKEQKEARPDPNAGIVQRYRAKALWDRRSFWAQWVALTRFEVVSTLKGLPFLIIMALSAFLVVVFMLDREVFYGVDSYPLTRLMVRSISVANWWALLAVLGFYSGEILHRERGARFHGIIDALPVSNRLVVTSKLTAMFMLMNVTLILGVSIAVGYQIYDGNVTVEWGLYLERIFFNFALPYMCLAVLACFFQVLAPNRLIGMVMMGLFIAFSIGMNDLLGSEHPLLKYGLGGFHTPYSDMNGAGRFREAGYWLRLYWVAIAGLLLVCTYGLWGRGTLQPLRFRLRTLKTRANALTALPLACVGLISAGYIFYNTNIVNDYYTSSESEQWRADYEKQFRQYEGLPMPRVMDVAVEVDLFPHQGRVEMRGTYLLRNKTDQDLQTVHLMFRPELILGKVALDGGLEVPRDKANYLIFEMEEPFLPGEERTLTFETTRYYTGFQHGEPDPTLVGNGTFIDNKLLTPYVGFNTKFLLKDVRDREAYGLEPLPRLPKLEDTAKHTNSVNRPDSDFIGFRATVSTVADQIAVAPGTLKKQWVEGDRRFFSYEAESPMMHFYTILSADYEVVRDHWEDVDIEIYYHEPHAYNVHRMNAAVKDSLENYSQWFSPYQFEVLRILEFPAYRKFAQSFATTIPYSEAIGFVLEVEDEDVDMPYYVTAHEMAHQWWGHQVTAANCQGASMLNESLSQYSALMLMERKFGKNKVHKFLALDLERYLEGRAGESEGELPLARVEKQSYIHYGKGSLIMYALRDYLGMETINRVLQRLIELRAFKSDPYATSADFLRLLREEAGPEHEGMIHDFFEKITLYDLKATAGEVKQRDDGRYDVFLDVSVAKLYADSLGNETAAPFDLPVDIGLFLRDPAEKGFNDDDVIMLKKQRINGDAEKLHFIVDRKPHFVGIDPYHKLIDRNIGDNLLAVQ